MALKSKYEIQLTGSSGFSPSSGFLSEGLEDAAQPAHDRGPHVLVGLLVGDEVNGSLAGRVPQHGVPGGPGQRDVVDGVEPRLRPEGELDQTLPIFFL